MINLHVIPTPGGVHCTLYYTWGTLYPVLYRGYTVPCTIHGVHCTLYYTGGILYPVLYRGHIVRNQRLHLKLVKYIYEYIFKHNTEPYNREKVIQNNTGLIHRFGIICEYQSFVMIGICVGILLDYQSIVQNPLMQGILLEYSIEPCNGWYPNRVQDTYILLEYSIEPCNGGYPTRVQYRTL